jgi:plasmid maintenance system antidote protein VapI
VTRKELATVLDISLSQLSMLFNGKRDPGFDAAERWRDLTGWTHRMWKMNTTAQRQKMFARIMTRETQDG